MFFYFRMVFPKFHLIKSYLQILLWLSKLMHLIHLFIHSFSFSEIHILNWSCFSINYAIRKTAVYPYLNLFLPAFAFVNIWSDSKIDYMFSLKWFVGFFHSNVVQSLL